MPTVKLARSPLGIISLFVVLIEAITAGMASFADLNSDSEVTFILVLFIVIFPVIVFIAFFYLVINHHTKLYGPSDFSNPNDFMELVRNSSNKIIDVNSFGRVNIFSPFHSNQPLQKEQQHAIERAVSDIEPILEGFNAYDFEILHSWYNSVGRHDLALLCINIAISKSSTSKNLSYRSASLRKLGRLSEALHSATVAAETDSSNVDAYYNLAVIYTLMKDSSKAKEATEIVLKSKSANYIQKLRARLDTPTCN